MKRPNSVSVSTDEAREVYEAQRDEICNLTLPPARELRDFHKELWIKYVDILKIDIYVSSGRE